MGLRKQDYFPPSLFSAINQLANLPWQEEHSPFMAALRKCEYLQQIKTIFLALFNKRREI